MKLSATMREAVADAQSRTLARRGAEACSGASSSPTLQTTGLNSLTSASGQRTYDHAIGEFVAWYFMGVSRCRPFMR
jgi:hypothetical protein